MKKIKIYRIKGYGIYTGAELAKTLGVHPRTVQAWRQNGLQVIDENQSPFLYEGIEVKRFLKARKSARKVNLLDHQFYCMKCRKAVTIEAEALTLNRTGKLLGNSRVPQIEASGRCLVCRSKVFRFSSTNRIAPLKKFYETDKSINFPFLQGDVKEVGKQIIVQQLSLLKD